MVYEKIKHGIVISVVLIIVSIIVSTGVLLRAETEQKISISSECDNKGAFTDIKVSETKNLTFYLHYVNASETAEPLPGGGSTLTYFDTTQDWNDVNVTYTVTVADVNFDWYLSPPLAGEFTVSAVAFKIWGRYVSGAAPQANVEVSVIELDSTGVESWEEKFFQESVTFAITEELKTFSGTLSTPHTFQAGSSIKLRFRFNPGLGKTFEFYYDTAQMNSRVEFVTVDSIKVSDIFTLDYLGTPQVNFDMTATNKDIKLRTKITDPFGGYDIRMVNLTLRDPDGNVILDNISMTKIGGTPLSFESEYEIIWNYSGYSPGEYNISIWTIDNNGIYYYQTYYDYGVYSEVGYGNFWLGGLPVAFYVVAYDSLANPLVGAKVSGLSGGKTIDSSITGPDGRATLEVVEATYDILVEWEGIIVGSQEDYTVSADATLTIDCNVFYPTFEVVDDLQNPLAGAAIYLTHPNGTYEPTPIKTDDKGLFTLTQVPYGYWNFIVRWRDVSVFDALVLVDFNGIDRIETLQCAVFTIEFQVLDVEDKPLIGAQLVVANSTSELVVDSQITDVNGRITSSLPIGMYDVFVYWHENYVGGLENYFVCANEVKTIVCEVYYVNIKTFDSKFKVVGDTQVIVTSPTTGSVLGSVKTNATTGEAKLRLPTGTHKVEVYWEDILVNTSIIEVKTTDLYFELQCEIYYLTITVVDSRAVPLADASVTIRSVATGKVVDVGITDLDGRFVTRVACGDYEVKVRWFEVEVKTAFTTVSADLLFLIYATVYYLEIHAVDSEGIPVGDATVMVFDATADRLIHSTSLNSTGAVEIRVPATELSIKINWREREVFYEPSYLLTGDTILVANCSVYYLTISALDVNNQPLEDAQITLAYHKGDVYDTVLVSPDSQMSCRVPIGAYDISVYWQGVLVYENINYSVTNTTELRAECEVYYLTVHAIDVEARSLEGAQITILVASTSTVYDSKLVGSDGKMTTRLPRGSYDILIHWHEVLVYEHRNYSVTDSTELSAICDVYYLTVRAVGNDGTAIKNVELLIKDMNGNVIDAGFTDSDGKATFRLPKGNYNIYGYFKTTYQLTEVDTKVSKNITVAESTYVTLKFSDYPPAYTSTVAFSIITLTSTIIIVIVVVIIVFLLLLRQRKKKTA